MNSCDGSAHAPYAESFARTGEYSTRGAVRRSGPFRPRRPNRPDTANDLSAGHAWYGWCYFSSSKPQPPIRLTDRWTSRPPTLPTHAPHRSTTCACASIRCSTRNAHLSRLHRGKPASAVSDYASRQSIERTGPWQSSLDESSLVADDGVDGAYATRSAGFFQRARLRNGS